MNPAMVLFLCGDVMLGRGLDQILPHPVPSQLHEPYVHDAGGYVRLAERKHGPIDSPVDFNYPWGQALGILDRVNPVLRLINLETSITNSEAYLRDKGIHYRMHPKNVPVLTAAKIDGCILANNHVLDWGRQGLIDTLDTLEDVGIKTPGAGRDAAEAVAPAVFELKSAQRLLVFAYALPTSGVPRGWSAGPQSPGVNHLDALDDDDLAHVKKQIARHAREGDNVMASIHWGGNWDWSIPQAQINFAHRLIDEAGVDLIHGHSAHHVKGFEVYHDRLILYGCGDLLNDYEGIGGHEAYRPDLSLMYFPKLDRSTGKLLGLQMTPMRIRQMQLHRAEADDVIWMQQTLKDQCKRFGVSIQRENDQLTAGW